LDAGADFNIVDSVVGTPLEAAIMANKPAMVELLESWVEHALPG
jgi:ankyrin repeat protein